MKPNRFMSLIFGEFINSLQ